MLSQAEVKIINERINLVKMNILFFREKCNIKSTNKFLSRFSVSAQEATKLTMLQHKNMTTPLVETYISTLNSRLGNCNEKSIVSYISLKKNPVIIMNNHLVSLVESYGTGADHVFIVIADHKINEYQVADISTLGETAIILDAWVEDWYLPNIRLVNSLQFESTIPTPIQFIIRQKISRMPIIGYPNIRPIL